MGFLPPGFHRRPALCGQRAPSVFVIAFPIHLQVFYTIFPALSRGKLVQGVSKYAVKGSQKGKRGQKSLDVWNDSGAFETRSGYRPVRKQLRHLEDFPAFAENTCCGVPE